MDVSIVVPLYNEQECVQVLHRAISDAVAPLSLQYQIIFVDDGSRDRTFEIAKTLAAEDKNLRVLKFRKNYGQTPAMAAGIDHAEGKLIVTMDGDLQNDPQDIPLLINTINEGFDIVVGWRHNRKDKLVSRKIPSKIANWLIGKVTGVPIKDNGCSLKAYRASVIKKIPLYNDMHRFIPAMASIAGPRLAQVKVRHNAREFGESKYGLSRVYKVLLDLMAIKTVSSFSSRPLRWFTLLSLPFLFVSMLIIFGSLIVLLTGGTVGIPIAGSGLMFFTLAAFLIVGGAIGELVHKTGDRSLTRSPLVTVIAAEQIDVSGQRSYTILKGDKK